jgi:hypothetical protein
MTFGLNQAICTFVSFGFLDEINMCVWELLSGFIVYGFEKCQEEPPRLAVGTPTLVSN